MRIKYEEMLTEFTRILKDKGFNDIDASDAAKIFVENSLDGVYSHGVNRFPKVIEYIDKGYINVNKKAERIVGSGSYEVWDGNLGLGVLNANLAMERAMNLAKEFGIGLVALRNTNHWMRAGYYGWQAANEGFVGICWTNTMPNMPSWGAMNSKIGNNPIVFAVPRSDGNHVIVDLAMSQFSYGKVEEYKLKDKQLPVYGGFNKDGELTTDPKEIEETGRILPTGFWKGSSMSITLDLIVSILSGGYSTTEIGRTCNGDEYGISQVFIAIYPYKYNSIELVDSIIDNVIKDIKESTPIDEGNEILYPGERVLKTRKDNLENGIPVVDSIWERIKNL